MELPNSILLRSFITISFLLFFSEVPNQEKGRDTNLTEVTNPPPELELKLVSDSINLVTEELERTKKVAQKANNEIIHAIKEHVKKEKQLIAKERELLRQVKAKESVIKELEKSIKEKDSLIVQLIVESHSDEVIEADSVCVKWKFLSKKIDENCVKWVR